MSAPVFDFKITFRPGFQADMDARFARLQFAFSQKVVDVVDKYVPLETGALKNSVNQASNFKEGLLVYNTPYARRQYYLHQEPERRSRHAQSCERRKAMAPPWAGHRVRL